MPVTAVDKDAAAASMTVTADFDSPVDHVWRLWSDPRLLERWWGPPSFPATFETHELTPGARSNYYMTAPDGSQIRGSWEIVSVDPPHGFEALDGDFADTGAPDPDMPLTRMTVRITETDRGARMSVTAFFPTAEDMQNHTGFEEGMRLCLAQADALLAAGLT